MQATVSADYLTACLAIIDLAIIDLAIIDLAIIDLAIMEDARFPSEIGGEPVSKTRMDNSIKDVLQESIRLGHENSKWCSC
jgi:hypothetical protein